MSKLQSIENDGGGVVNRSDEYSICVISNLGTNYLPKTSPSLWDGSWKQQQPDLDSTDEKDYPKAGKATGSKKLGFSMMCCSRAATRG